MKKLRICMISNQYPPYYVGGDAALCRDLAEGLAQRDFEVHVIFDPFTYTYMTGKEVEKLPESFIQNRVIVHPLPSSPAKLAFFQLNIYNRHPYLSQKIAEISPHILHYHNFSGFGWGALNAAGNKIPKVMTLHDLWIACPIRAQPLPDCDYLCMKCELKKMRPPSFRRLKDIEQIECFICPSRYIESEIKKRYPNVRTVVIPNFVDTTITNKNVDNQSVEEFKKYFQLDNKVIGLFVGRLDRRKGLDILINAVRQLPQDFVFILIGDDAEGFGNLINNNVELKNKLLVLGKVDDIKKRISFAVADFFVLPTRWENFPLSIIEAMAWELPIISTRIGGVPELVEDGENGFLINSGDSKELYEKLLSIREIIKYKNNKLLEIRSKNSQKIKNNFFRKKIINQYLRVYKFLLNGGKENGDNK
ncbi:MAG: glycosyltransferase family 4 protein [Thermoplasmata archaeon]